jgi:methyl-accepting chemotaxis protein
MTAADGVSGITGSMAKDGAAVAGAAQQALSDAQSVAAAVEELSSSVREIAGQVSGATQATRRAVSEGEASAASIQELAGTVARIGDITSLIADIAGQTNLLALNATIEAARAGEAGRGFAVVAGEVKQLAAQTAKATGEIAGQVSAIGAATEAAVARVGGIAAAVAEIDQVAAAIAAAVEQQSAATQEIARTIAQTADGSRQVADRIQEVSAATHQAETLATEMSGAANDARAAIIGLRPALVRAIRASAPEVNRRSAQRFAVLSPARLIGPGLPAGGAEVRLLDLSIGGAALEWVPGAAPGQRVTLALPSLLATPLPAEVLAAEETRTRLRFLLEPRLTEALAATLQQFEARAA